MRSSRARFTATAQVLDLELDVVSTAIAMVATGGASRVLLAGLRFGEQILPVAMLRGRSAGVQVTPLWSADDDDGIDLSVEEARDGGQ
jgi:hypothetical protein